MNTRFVHLAFVLAAILHSQVQTHDDCPELRVIASTALYCGEIGGFGYISYGAKIGFDLLTKTYPSKEARRQDVAMLRDASKMGTLWVVGGLAMHYLTSQMICLCGQPVNRFDGTAFLF